MSTVHAAGEEKRFTAVVDVALAGEGVLGLSARCKINRFESERREASESAVSDGFVDGLSMVAGGSVRQPA